MTSAKNKKKSPSKVAATLVGPSAPTVNSGVSAIIGVGASAGGLEAFEAFLRACPTNAGMSFVLITHLNPDHPSQLPEILQRCTSMPVVQAQDLMAVARDHVYVIAPNTELSIFKGVLHVSGPNLPRGQNMPVDSFFRSLAEDQREKAIGIILSGTATDGTLGLRAIYGNGGVCLVQYPLTAKYDGMPQSAISAGYVTHILPPEEMPKRLLQLTAQTSLRLAVSPNLPKKTLSNINKILMQLRATTGHDFSQYKKSTIGRRIERRMAQHQIEDAAIYTRFLKENPSETQLLFRELLINVTSFFRDPDAFIELKQTILPPLLANVAPGTTFRVWVAGCSTGEEAYSIAMVLHELQAEMWATHEQELSIQIYATDLDDEAIAVARAGRYLANIAQDITPERLRRFFTKDPEPNGGYKVKKNIRDMVVFAVQNVIKDPPFTRLNLLSCRNLMIYLEPELQNRLIRTFHYALKPNGVLLLSTSESIINQPELFSALDRRWKFFQVRHTGAVSKPQPIDTLPMFVYQTSKTGEAVATNTPKIVHTTANIADMSNRALLQSYAPASVTTDAQGNILYVHGDTGKYLSTASGPFSNNVADMAREGLQLDLRTAILHIAASSENLLSEEVSIKTNGAYAMARFTVQRLPLKDTSEYLLLISFHDIAIVAPTESPASEGKRGTTSAKSRAKATTTITPADLTRITELERKLSYANETLQSTYEEQQAFNEELKSTNEELQSTNEELQSSNEELETSKEELQSLNEETITVNAELNARIEQLTTVQNDMKNLLDSINTGTLFLDHELRIRRFTAAALKIYRLIAADVGRPLSDITSNLAADQLKSLQIDLQKVLDTLIPIEREVTGIDGTWYLARIQPYRTLDNVIEGLVLTFTNVTEIKLTSEAAQRAIALQAATQVARELAEGIVNTLTEPIMVLDGNLQVVSASNSFYTHFQVSATETVGRKIYELGNGQWAIARLTRTPGQCLVTQSGHGGLCRAAGFPRIRATSHGA